MLDTKKVWQIRNYPQNRRNFNNSDKIALKSHLAWFKHKYFTGKDNYCFILENEKRYAIGYCRFDFEKEGRAYIVSIAISPDYQGLGLGDKLLYGALRQFDNRHDILAEIKRNNIASLKLFEKNGFKTFKTDEKNYYLKYKKNNVEKNYVIAAINPWNVENFKLYFGKKRNFYFISKKEDLTYKKLKAINPRYIFLPHWSWIIPEEIWSNFECVVFHMTDLPYGRGGTPLQNLIIRGHKKTKISAIRANGRLDAGDVYLKEGLSLAGRAEEIYWRATKIIYKKMISYIIKNNPIAQKQIGRPTIFKRIKPKQSKITDDISIKKIYDFIRMLDAEKYPNAFLETKYLKFSFSKVKKSKNKFTAAVTIYEK